MRLGEATLNETSLASLGTASSQGPLICALNLPTLTSHMGQMRQTKQATQMQLVASSTFSGSSRATLAPSKHSVSTACAAGEVAWTL